MVLQTTYCKIRIFARETLNLYCEVYQLITNFIIYINQHGFN